MKVFLSYGVISSVLNNVNLLATTKYEVVPDKKDADLVVVGLFIELDILNYCRINKINITSDIEFARQAGLATDAVTKEYKNKSNIQLLQESLDYHSDLPLNFRNIKSYTIYDYNDKVIVTKEITKRDIFEMEL